MSTAELTHLNQYLTFTLGDEIFAQEISEVREVLEYTTITCVPRTPDYLVGVINLRGNAVPVVDVRLKLGMSKTERTVNTCIIITEIELDDGQTVLGALVDSVKEVMEIDQEILESAPKIGTKMNTDFIKGMGKQDDKFIMILDVEKVFSSEELAIVQGATSESKSEVEKEPESELIA